MSGRADRRTPRTVGAGLRDAVPLLFRRYWSVGLVLAWLLAGFAWQRLVGVAVVAGVLVVSAVVLPRRVNLVVVAVGRLWRPDGAPWRRARIVRAVLAGSLGVRLPSRLYFTSWHRDRQAGTESFRVRLWPGEYIARWTGHRAEALRVAFRADEVEVREVTPGEVDVFLAYGVTSGVTTSPVPPQAMFSRTDMLSQPVPVGWARRGELVSLSLNETNILVAGVPGMGKSNILQLVVGWAALDPHCQLVLIDGKELSELGRWQPVAQSCAGSLAEAVSVLLWVEQERARRAEVRAARGWRKWPSERGGVLLVVIDQLAEFTDTTGYSGAEKLVRQEFTRLLVRLVRRGRADRVVVVAATQRPSADVVPTQYRDLVQLRVGLRCTTREQSEVALGSGACSEGADASTLPPRPGCFIVRGASPTWERGQAYEYTDAQIEQTLVAAKAVRGVPDDGATPVAPVPAQLPPAR